VPFHNGENSNGYRTNTKLVNQSVRKLRTIGTMFVLGVRVQRWAELGWVAGDAVGGWQDEGSVCV